MKAKLVGVIQVQLPSGREAVALLFDNMRWVLDYSDYKELSKEVGSTVDFADLHEQRPARLN